MGFISVFISSEYFGLEISFENIVEDFKDLISIDFVSSVIINLSKESELLLAI